MHVIGICMAACGGLAALLCGVGLVAGSVGGAALTGMPIVLAAACLMLVGAGLAVGALVAGRSAEQAPASLHRLRAQLRILGRLAIAVIAIVALIALVRRPAGGDALVAWLVSVLVAAQAPICLQLLTRSRASSQRG